MKDSLLQGVKEVFESPIKIEENKIYHVIDLNKREETYDK